MVRDQSGDGALVHQERSDDGGAEVARFRRLAVDAHDAETSAHQGLEHGRRLGADVQAVPLARAGRRRVEREEAVGPVDGHRRRARLRLDLRQHARGAALGQALAQGAEGGAGEGERAQCGPLLEGPESLPLPAQAVVDQARRGQRQRDLEHERLFPAHALMLRQRGLRFNLPVSWPCQRRSPLNPRCMPLGGDFRPLPPDR